MKLFIVTLLIVFCSCQGTYSQMFRGSPEERAEKLYMEAYAYIMDRDFNKAERALKRAIELYEEHEKSYLLLGDVYFQTREHEKGIEIYGDLLEIEPENKRALYNQALLYFRTGKYHEAHENYRRVDEIGGLSSGMQENLQRWLEHTEFAIKLVENPLQYEPQNLGSGVNTDEDEYWPALTADERTLYFTRHVPEYNERGERVGFREDIFVSHKKNGEWQEAVSPPGPLNSMLNEGAIALSPDGRYLVFTGCNRPDVHGRCDLYKSEFKNNQWTRPENMGSTVNSPHLDRQPSISFDGNTIYFSSSRPGNIGDIDIWKTNRDENGEWTKPVNLGDVINTRGREQAPFIHPDNETLYFVSDGHMGLGGTDIFYARKNENGEFDTVINMGYPINTHKNSFSLMVSHNGDRAFFSSEMEPSYGGKDIFSFEMPEDARPQLTTYLKGNVYNATNRNPLHAKFEVIDLQNDKTIIESTSDAVTGEFLISLPGNRDYALNVSREGYMFFSQNLSLKARTAHEPFEQDIPLQPILAGEAVVLENVFFDLDSYELLPESKTELNRLIRFLETNPELKIELGGHTDNQGSIEYNEELSDNRARAVYNYLIQAGDIDPERLTYKGYGEHQPIATNETEEGRAKNRRTEFKIIEN